MSEDRDIKGGAGAMGVQEDARLAAEELAKAGLSSEGAALPEVSFSAFILSLASSAAYHLGELPPEAGGPGKLDLPLAKHTIDILAMLERKTSPCLEQAERELLQNLLTGLRMGYVAKAG